MANKTAKKYRVGDTVYSNTLHHPIVIWDFTLDETSGEWMYRHKESAEWFKESTLRSQERSPG